MEKYYRYYDEQWNWKQLLGYTTMKYNIKKNQWEVLENNEEKTMSSNYSNVEEKAHIFFWKRTVNNMDKEKHYI